MAGSGTFPPYPPPAVPEGHTIHRAARDQRPLMLGKPLVVTAPDGRHLDAAARLDGRAMTGIEPVGKHLFYRFDAPPPNRLHVHLALFGRLILYAGKTYPPPEPRGALRYRLDAGDAALDLHGCRTADLVDEDHVGSVKARLGPDPLASKPDPEPAWRRISKSKALIAGLLMDQSVVSGLGNIYRAEILFRQRIHPKKPGRDLTREQFDGLWRDAVDLLKLGVKYDRIITVTREFARERHGKPLSKLARRQRWYVYKQPTCPFTGGAVETFDLAGRTVYWSPAWQTG